MGLPLSRPAVGEVFVGSVCMGGGYYWTSLGFLFTITHYGKTADRGPRVVRSELVALRIRPQQYKSWSEQAKRQGVSLPEWIRQVVDRAARTG